MLNNSIYPLSKRQTHSRRADNSQDPIHLCLSAFLNVLCHIPDYFGATMFLLKLCGNTNLQEINVTQTAMSAGAMVAGGLAFTIPGIWMLDPDAEVELGQLLVVTLGGVVLGLIFTALFRKYFIETKELPYAMGQAAAEEVGEQRREHERQQERQRIHAALAQYGQEN